MKTDKKILDVTCGGRSIWFNKNHPLALYCDRREEEWEKEFGTQKSTRHIKVHPDMLCDFRQLPFEDNTFNLVVFDPPHIVSKNGDNRWFTKAYGFYTTKEEALDSVRGGGKRVHESASALWSIDSEMGRDVNTYAGNNKAYRLYAPVWT